MSRNEIFVDMRETIGIVPKFFEGLPDWDLEHEWKIFKNLILGETTVPNKYKELIGLGVSAALRCRYCTLFHTEAARMRGATEDEIKEALLVAKTVSGWSTYLNGSRYDEDLFRQELEQVGRFLMDKGKKKEVARAGHY